MEYDALRGKLTNREVDSLPCKVCAVVMTEYLLLLVFLNIPTVYPGPVRRGTAAYALPPGGVRQEGDYR